DLRLAIGTFAWLRAGTVLSPRSVEVLDRGAVLAAADPLVAGAELKLREGWIISDRSDGLAHLLEIQAVENRCLSVHEYLLDQSICLFSQRQANTPRLAPTCLQTSALQPEGSDVFFQKPVAFVPHFSDQEK